MEISLSYMILGYAICYASTITPFIYMFILNLAGFKYYTIYPDRESLTRLERTIAQLAYTKSSSIKHINGRDFNSGIYIGWTCIAIVDNRSAETSVHIIASADTYAIIMKEEEDKLGFLPELTTPIQEATQYVTVFKRRGTYKCFYYNSRKLDLGHIQPIGDQINVVDDILKEYAVRGRATVFIHGNPCTGKSTIGYLIAKQLRGRYCHTFNPCDPGDCIHELLNASEVDSSAPLVIVLEEVDCIIESILSNTLKLSPDIPTQVHSKATWTTFLDDMVFIKYVVLILTSNSSKETLDKRDASLLREGRIHASYCMNVPIL